MPLPCSRASISCSSAMISPEDQPLIRRTEPALLSQLGGGLARRARRLAALESVQRPEVVHIPRLWPHHQPEPAAVVWQRVHREVVAHAAVAVDVPAVPEGLHQPGHAHRHADRHPQGQVRVLLAKSGIIKRSWDRRVAKARPGPGVVSMHARESVSAASLVQQKQARLPECLLQHVASARHRVASRVAGPSRGSAAARGPCPARRRGSPPACRTAP